MGKKKKPEEPDMDLRKQAEERLNKQGGQELNLSSLEKERLIHELEVHQIELEMQNEELRKAQELLEGSRIKYLTLYDRTPLTYITLSEKGIIIEANQVATDLFGIEKDSLLKQPITKFILNDDQDIYYLHHKRLTESKFKQQFELRMEKKGGSIFYANLITDLCEEEDGTSLYLVIINDINEQVNAKQKENLSNESARKSEALYSGLVETSQNLFWQCDIEGRYIYLNPEWENVFGYKISEMLGRKFTEFQSPEHAERDQIEFRRIISGKTVKGFETIHIGKTGNEINLLFNSTPTIDKAGNFIGAQGTAYDVTEQKDAERHIQHLASFPKYNPEPIIELDLKGKIKYYNPAVIAVLQDLKLDDPEVFLHSSINEIIKDLDKGTGKPIISEIKIKKRFFIQNICYVKGFDSVRIFYQDITERKYAEAQLIESEKKYRAVFENANETISIVQNGIIKLTNSNFYKVTGYSLEEISKQNPHDIIHPDDREKVIGHNADSKRGGGDVVRYTFRIIDKNTNIKWLDRNISQVLWEGKPALLLIDNDITELKSFEEEKQIAYEALNKSESRFRVLSDSSPLAIYETDKDGNCIYVNNEWCKLAGLSPKEAAGNGWVNGIHPEDREYIQKLWYENAENNTPWYFEYRFLNPAGKTTWVLGSAVAIKDSSDNITGYIGANLDITERKESEEVIRASEADLEEAQRMAAIGSWSFDPITEKPKWSKQMFHIWGLNPSQDPPDYSEHKKIIHPDDYERFNDAVLKAVEQGIPYKLDLRICRPDGIIKNIIAMCEPLCDDTGRAVSLKGTIQDITERKLMEEELKRLHEIEKAKNLELVVKNLELKEARNATLNIIDDLVAQNEELEQTEELLKKNEMKFRTVADFTYDWEYWENENKQIEYMSPSCERMTGYSPYELTSNPGLLSEMIYREDKAAYHDHDHTVVSLKRKENIEELEYRIVKKDTSLVYIQHICRPIFDENNNYLGRRISNRDITDRKKAEEEIKKYQEHLEELVELRTAELEIINRKLKNEIVKGKEVEKMLRESLDKEKELGELKTQFVSTVSHEFRTPLTTILSSVELLQKYGRKWDEDKYLKHTIKVVLSIDHLTSLLENVLLISKADSGKVEFNPTLVHLNIFCEDIINEVKPMISKNHQLLLDYKAKETEFLIDEKLMRMVLFNLLSNAIKYSPMGGVVKLTVIQEENLIIVVSDEGIGIETKDRDKVFDSFYRTEEAGEFAGTGLGLAIVKRSVNLHGGEISIKSEKKQGTEFLIEIPINKD